MTVARHYVMTAAEGKGDDLSAALDGLADAVRAFDGCEGVESLRDVENPLRFVFIEKWASVDAHKAVGPKIPKEVFAPVQGALGAPPEGSYLDYTRVI